MRPVQMRRLLSLLVVTCFAGALLAQLGGCNTVKGLGRDVEAVAQGGQDIIDGKP